MRYSHVSLKWDTSKVSLSINIEMKAEKLVGAWDKENQNYGRDRCGPSREL